VPADLKKSPQRGGGAPAPLKKSQAQLSPLKKSLEKVPLKKSQEQLQERVVAKRGGL
jgi:hypothetical protein